MVDVTLGQVIWSAVKPIIKIYLIIGTGFFLAKRNILTVETTRNISDIILTILLPCLVFNKIVSNIEDSDIKNVGIICLSSVIIFGTGGLCGIIVKLTSPVPKKWFGGLLAGAIFPNISDIPIAYLQTLDTGLVFTEDEGNKGIAHVCIFLAMFTLCLFNIGGFRLIEYDFRDILNPVVDEENQNEKIESSEGTRVPTNEEEQAISDVSGNDDESDESDDDSSSLSQTQPPKDQTPIALTNENNKVHRRNTIDQQQLRTLRNRHQSRRRNSSISTTRTSMSRVPTAQSQASNLSYYSRMRTPDIRRMPSQTMNDVVNEYSEIDRLHTIDSQPPRLSEVLTTDVGVTGEDIEKSGPPFMQKYHLGIIVFFLKNCLRPCASSLIASLTIAFIPWVKALFVKTTVYMPNAPDELPPLNFIMDYTSYVGAASVPFALILLGGSIARLKLGSLYPGFWRASLLLVVLRLCVMPILGVLWVNRLVSSGWIDKEDHMLMFVIMISWALPSMTTQVYFTAFYTPLDAEDRTQMDCVSVYLLMQYPLLVISLPFLVTYIVKVQFA
ncbi:unnamed protein product [Wickerhamomyces anomalus]